MSEYKVVEKDIWKLSDGSIWEGNVNQCPEGNPDNVAKAGKEYPTAWLKEQGWGKKKAAPKKAAPKKPAEEKAVKKSDVEDKAVKKDVEDK